MPRNRRRSRRGSYQTGLILILLGTLLLLDQMDLVDFGDVVSTFWPLIFVFIGLRMILARRDQQPETDELELPVVAARVKSEEDRIFCSGVFGDFHRKIGSKQFLGGKCSITFGDVDLDLTEVGLASGQRTLYLSTVFGDIRLMLPADIPILIRASCTAGAIDLRTAHASGILPSRSYKTADFDTAEDRLVIVASSFFGDIKAW